MTAEEHGREEEAAELARIERYLNSMEHSIGNSSEPPPGDTTAQALPAAQAGPPGAISLVTGGGAIYAPNWHAYGDLLARVNLAQGQVADYKREGTLGYIQSNLGGVLCRAGLVVITNLYTGSTAADKAASVCLTFTIADPDSGAMLQTAWNATGPDVAGAAAVAQRDWLAKTLLLSDGDDLPPAPAAAPADPLHSRESPTRITVEQAASVPPLPSERAIRADIQRWMLLAARAVDWPPAELEGWLARHFHVNKVHDLGARTWPAAQALHRQLTGEEPLS